MFNFPLCRLRKDPSRCPNVVVGQSSAPSRELASQNDVDSLGKDQLRVSAAAADVGMLPIPPETRINFAVVTSDAPETQNHTSEKP